MFLLIWCCIWCIWQDRHERKDWGKLIFMFIWAGKSVSRPSNDARLEISFILIFHVCNKVNASTPGEWLEGPDQSRGYLNFMLWLFYEHGLLETVKSYRFWELPIVIYWCWWSVHSLYFLKQNGCFLKCQTITICINKTSL